MTPIPSNEIRLERIEEITVHGAEFVVTWDMAAGEVDLMRARIDAVCFGETWFHPADALGRPMRDALNRKLRNLFAADLANTPEGLSA